MRTLRLVRRIVNYTFSPPWTPQKIVLMLLGLVLGSQALIGAYFALLIIGFAVAHSGILPWDDRFDESDASRWKDAQSQFWYLAPPQWTPDGNTIYSGDEGYLRYTFRGDDGYRDLTTYVVSSDGSELKKLKHVVGPDISPDGSLIVYSTWRDTGELSYDIETAKPDGSDRRRLTEDSTYIDIGAARSPDGSSIAFARVAHQSQDLDPGTDERGIYVMAEDGSGLRRVYRLRGSLLADPVDESIDSGPVWSPDGETLAFAIGEISTEKRPQRGILYAIGADGSNLTAVYVNIPGGARVRSLVWSPGGSRLAFELGFPYIVNSDGTGLRKAADVRFVDRVSWSPDGTRLLMVGSSQKQKTTGGFSRLNGVHVAEADDGSYEYLGGGTRAAWSPDGSRIAVVKDYARNIQLPAPYLQTMAPDGSDVQVLAERDEDDELRAANSR